MYRDPEFCSIFPDGNSSELDDGDFLEVGAMDSDGLTGCLNFQEGETSSSLRASAEPFRPIARGSEGEEGRTEGDLEDWCLVGGRSDSESGGGGSEEGGSSGRSSRGEPGSRSQEDISGRGE